MFPMRMNAISLTCLLSTGLGCLLAIGLSPEFGTISVAEPTYMSDRTSSEPSEGVPGHRVGGGTRLAPF